MLRLLGLPTLLALFMPVPASANWQNLSANQADRAFYSSVSGGRSLQLGCFRGANGLRMTLLGGSQALPKTVQSDTAVMVWIELPDGRTGRYPVDTEYMGGGDNALLGTLMLGRQGMDFFAAGATLFITDTRGTELFRSGMKGTSTARKDFNSACGL